MLQSLPKNLLPFRRQTLECRIILKRALLLRWRHIFIAPEPVSRVAARLWAHLRPRRLLALRRSRDGRVFILG